MDKKLSLMITGTITISVTLSMASAYLLDSNNFSFRDFKGYYQNAENFRHSMLIDCQRMRSQRNGTQAEPDFEKMAQTIFRRVDTNSDNVTTMEEVEATLKLSMNERMKKKASFNTKRR